MTRRRALWAGTVVAMVVVAILGFPFAKTVGMQVLDSMRGSAGSVGDPIPVATAVLGGEGPGSLVSAMTMPGFSRRHPEYRMRSARVVYRSTTGAGQPTEVSGSVFVPRDDPPPGGWPVIAFSHGTLGIDEPCAPSLSDDLLGSAETVGILTTKGFAVALPDYQGLGTPGVHPYTDSTTAGRNVIDAVRALRATFPTVSNRWGAFGGSQGGGAAWAADEQAHDYAPELTLVGAVAVSPVADLTGLVDKAQHDALTTNQQLGLITIVESLARLHPEFSRDDFRRGAAAQYWDTLLACSRPDIAARDAAIKALQASDVAPSTPSAADRLRQYLAQWALPQKRLTAPLYVWYGGQDTFLDPAWTAGAIARACALGGAVVAVFDKDKGHVEVDYVDQFTWLTDRFATKPVTNACA